MVTIARRSLPYKLKQDGKGVLPLVTEDLGLITRDFGEVERELSICRHKGTAIRI